MISLCTCPRFQGSKGRAKVLSQVHSLLACAPLSQGGGAFPGFLPTSESAPGAQCNPISFAGSEELTAQGCPSFLIPLRYFPAESSPQICKEFDEDLGIFLFPDQQNLIKPCWSAWDMAAKPCFERCVLSD